MDAGRGPVGQWRAVQAGIHPLLVEGVTCLVQHAKERVSQEFALHPRGDAHVAGGKVDGEGMGRLVLAAPLQVIADPLGGRDGGEFQRFLQDLREDRGIDRRRGRRRSIPIP